MTMKLTYSDDKDNPNVVLAKAQAKADHWRQRAETIGAVLFDVLYPEYTKDEKEFKANYVYYKEELGRVIKQRDDVKTQLKKMANENARLRALMIDELKGGNNVKA
jgi:hypothetical protein